MKNPKTLPTLSQSELLKTQTDMGLWDHLIDSAVPWVAAVPAGGITAIQLAERSVLKGKPMRARNATKLLETQMAEGSVTRSKYRIGRKSMWEWVYFPTPPASKRKP